MARVWNSMLEILGWRALCYKYSVGKLSVHQQRKCMMFAFTPFGHDRLRPPQSSQCTYRLFYCELGHWIEPHELLYWVYFRLKGKKCWNTKLWTFKVRLNFWFCCERNWIHSIQIALLPRTTWVRIFNSAWCICNCTVSQHL